jgi:hypothetical protein
MPKKKAKKSPSIKMSRQTAQGLVDLIVETRPVVRGLVTSIGYQTCTRTDMDLDEVEYYLRDHVIDLEGEGLTSKDCRLISKTLETTSKLLASPEVRDSSPLAQMAGKLAVRLHRASLRLAR